MASKGTEANRSSPQIFDCESVEVTPGMKSRHRLPRGLEEGPSPYPRWWTLGGAVVAAMLIGVAIGHFLLS